MILHHRITPARISAPSLDRLHDKITAYTLAFEPVARRVSVSAGKQHGQWVADIQMELV